MKRSRRQELKTNELSVYLQQMYEFLQQHATYIIGGIVVVVLILVIALLNARSVHQQRFDGWAKYESIQQGDVVADPTLLDQARALAADFGDDAELGPMVLQLKADKARTLALQESGTDDADRQALLEEAAESYSTLISRFSEHEYLLEGARIGLASVQESLHMFGAGDLDKARSIYKELAEAEDSPYRDVAQQLLDTFDERTEVFTIVEAPAPEEPETDAEADGDSPATAPATTSTAPAAG